MSERVDTRALMADIEAEARARRMSGVVPADFEAELDAKFAALTPKSRESDFARALQYAEADALFDYQPPLDSSKPGGTAVKKGLAKLSAWYIRFLGQQVTAFALNITNAVRLLGERVERIEVRTGEVGAADVARLAERIDSESSTAGWDDEIVSALQGTSGRVLVAHAGSGALVQLLVGAGVDAYGIEPVDRPELRDLDPALEIRSDTLNNHLKTVADGELSAVVLTGVPDTMTVGGVYDLVGELGRVMSSGGRLCVVSTDPEQWRRRRNGVIADLTFGAPLAPATWCELLGARGFDEVGSSAAKPQAIVQDLPGTDPVTVAVNDQLRALEAAIVVSPSHLIRARRSG